MSDPMQVDYLTDLEIALMDQKQLQARLLKVNKIPDDFEWAVKMNEAWRYCLHEGERERFNMICQFCKRQVN